MILQSAEDYIKTIYKIEGSGKKVTTSALARHLRLGDASVTDMIKRLSEKKLIHYTPYRGVSLSESGRRLALKTLRRHRLWEMFLVQFLGYTWDEVHEEAERLEHITSEDLEQRIDKALDFPKVDPHGDPIPNARGEMAKLGKLHSLAETDCGVECIVVRVSDDSAELLQYMSRLGLALNRRIKVCERIEFDGSVIIRIGTQEIPLSSALAQRIFVEAK